MPDIASTLPFGDQAPGVSRSVGSRVGSGIGDVKPPPDDTSRSGPAPATSTANRLVAVDGVRQQVRCNGRRPTRAPSGVTSRTGPLASPNIPAPVCRAKAIVPVAGFGVAGVWGRDDPGVAAGRADDGLAAAREQRDRRPRDDRDGRNG